MYDDSGLARKRTACGEPTDRNGVLAGATVGGGIGTALERSLDDWRRGRTGRHHIDADVVGAHSMAAPRASAMRPPLAAEYKVWFGMPTMARRELTHPIDVPRRCRQRHQVLHDQERAQQIAVQHLACVVVAGVLQGARCLVSVAKDNDLDFSQVLSCAGGELGDEGLVVEISGG
jgi:hypothetical protein